MVVFSTPLVNCCPSTFSLTYLLPLPSPPPYQSKRTVYTDRCGCGGGVLSCVVDHILQEFNSLFSLTRFRTYKIATTPQTKTPVKTTFRIGVFILPSSMVSGCTSGKRRRRPCLRTVPAFASLPPATPRRAADQWLTARRIRYWRRVSSNSS